MQTVNCSTVGEASRLGRHKIEFDGYKFAQAVGKKGVFIYEVAKGMTDRIKYIAPMPDNFKAVK